MIKRFLSILMILTTFSAANAQVSYYMVVARDGSGDYTSIQAAIDNTKAFPDKHITIYIKNGLYNEQVKVFSWNNLLTLKGESKANTIIRHHDYFYKIDKGRNSTFHTPTLLVQGNDFIAENLTIENTAGAVGQAVALALEADRCVVSNCIIKGNQDTVYTAGEGNRQYFKNCFIEGTTDYIFGEATVVFEECTIHSKADSYITAASTSANVKYGYVFKNCKLTAAEGATQVYLGRPWRPWAKTVFIESEMGDFIRPEGWHNWSKPEAEKTSFYAEYKNKGRGFKPDQRVNWSHQLTKGEAKKYNLESIFGKGDWYKGF